MLRGIKAVIFDLDGTLADSMWMWKRIDIEYLRKFNISLPEDLQKSIEGMSFSETAVYFKNRFHIEDTLEQIKRDWNNMARDKYKNQVRLKEGALEFLKDLKRREIKTGIATSNSKDLVGTLIESQGIEEMFQSVRTACEVERGKPAPDIYIKVASDLGVRPEECLVFEDIPAGILAGKNAGMKVCAVEDEFSRDLLTEKKRLADYYIQSYREIRAKSYEVLG
jgi:HAD superfamily hydrolase (TIGR01509 family)